jgi:hypothetical protein
MGYVVRKAEKPRPWKIHPIWRGLGCIMMILIPIIAYAASSLVVENIDAVKAFLTKVYITSISVDLLAWTNYIVQYVPQISEQVATVKQALNLKPVDYFWGKVMLAVVFSLILFAILSIFYSLIFSISGGSPRSPLDVEPERYKKKKKTKRAKYG